MKYSLLFFTLSSLTAFTQSPSMVEKNLDSLFSSYFTAGEPGGAVLIVKDGKMIYKKGFGVADLQTKEPVTTQTLFNIGSISKTFVAYGILN